MTWQSTSELGFAKVERPRMRTIRSRYVFGIDEKVTLVCDPDVTISEIRVIAPPAPPVALMVI